jgi:hypothetical protein
MSGFDKDSEVVIAVGGGGVISKSCEEDLTSEFNVLAKIITKIVQLNENIKNVEKDSEDFKLLSESIKLSCEEYDSQKNNIEIILDIVNKNKKTEVESQYEIRTSKDFLDKLATIARSFKYNYPGCHLTNHLANDTLCGDKVSIDLYTNATKKVENILPLIRDAVKNKLTSDNPVFASSESCLTLSSESKIAELMPIFGENTDEIKELFNAIVGFEKAEIKFGSGTIRDGLQPTAAWQLAGINENNEIAEYQNIDGKKTLVVKRNYVSIQITVLLKHKGEILSLFVPYNSSIELIVLPRNEGIVLAARGIRPRYCDTTKSSLTYHCLLFDDEGMICKMGTCFSVANDSGTTDSFSPTAIALVPLDSNSLTCELGKGYLSKVGSKISGSNLIMICDVLNGNPSIYQFEIKVMCTID